MSIDRCARIVWDYHHVQHTLGPADCIIVLGSHDTRVAERGAEVFLAGFAPLLVFSGNLGALTSGVWDRPEAEIFADVAAAMGVPRERMLIEARATNTSENVDFSRRLLSQHGVQPKRAIAVQKPYMERRTLATFRQRWPELDVAVTSPQIEFDAYPNDLITREDVIHIMVGDFQRLLGVAPRAYSALAALGLWPPLQAAPTPLEMQVYERRPHGDAVRLAWMCTNGLLRALNDEVKAHGSWPSTSRASWRSASATLWDRGQVARSLTHAGESVGFPVLDLTRLSATPTAPSWAARTTPTADTGTRSGTAWRHTASSASSASDAGWSPARRPLVSWLPP